MSKFFSRQNAQTITSVTYFLLQTNSLHTTTEFLIDFIIFVTAVSNKAFRTSCS
eukprot:TRINITY_DN2062_c0_g1_i1.p1 TRINITY_DN2062_c0_g1~~TRINITY_DN2062_c0_g1_i1.p1  ORF type:complete len:54 (+),score=3.66 TRINITY_DN2062_c0_g1_i1:365-526(+)